MRWLILTIAAVMLCVPLLIGCSGRAGVPTPPSTTLSPQYPGGHP